MATASPDHGIALVLGDDAEGLGNATFLARSASLGQHPDQFSFLFDSGKLTPRIDTEPFVEALAALIALKAAGPPGMERFDAEAARQAFRTGKVALLIDRAERAAAWSHGKPVGVAPLPGSERVFDPGSKTWITPPRRNAPSYLPHGGGWLVGVRSGLAGHPARGGDRPGQVPGQPGELGSHPRRAGVPDAAVPHRADEPGPARPDLGARRRLAALVGGGRPDVRRAGRGRAADPRRRRTTWPTWPRAAPPPWPAPRRSRPWRTSPGPGPSAPRPAGRSVSSGIIVAASTSAAPLRSPRNQGPDDTGSQQSRSGFPARRELNVGLESPTYGTARLTVDDETDDSLSTLSGDIETEIKEMMGLFDAPAFARRGHELEEMLRRVDARCRQARIERLDMVRVRLRQWTRVATGPDAWTSVFTASIEPLWPLCEAEPPQWAATRRPRHRQLAVARDLVAAVERFNRRWAAFVESINLGPANVVIDHYNRYYVLEKECVMGSARLAARFFTPIASLDPPSSSCCDHPLLPVPGLVDRGRFA